MIWILLAATSGLVFYWWVEARRHWSRLHSIPIRIHVNGTRGKSSVTRLIAAGLRASGRRVVAKTTGTAPRLILPDGTERPIARNGPPNIREQLHVVRDAFRLKADALVVECMAVQPALQWTSEHRMIRSTHGVITNVRPDHLDVMGPTLRDVARSLSQTIPDRGELFTAEREHFGFLKQRADSKGIPVRSLDHERLESLRPRVTKGFAHIEHVENVALALEVCRVLGVPEEAAFESMRSARPDPGAATVAIFERPQGRLHFVNAFAANDPDSILMLWAWAVSRLENRPVRRGGPSSITYVALVNCRGDRTDRSYQIGLRSQGFTPLPRFVLAGLGAHAFVRGAREAGLPEEFICSYEGIEPQEVINRLWRSCETETLVVGMGNTGGIGMELLEILMQKGVSLKTAAPESFS